MKRSEQNQSVRNNSIKHVNQVQKKPEDSACESLELRRFLSGNVLAQVVDGNLTVAGDSTANTITLNQTGLKPHQMRILGSSDTTINGVTGSIILNGVRGDISVRMASGADSVTVRDVSAPQSLGISQGGRDTLLLNGVTVAGNLFLRNSSSLLPMNSTLLRTLVGKDLNISSGAGGQMITMASVDVMDDAQISTGHRYDVVTIDDSNFESSFDVSTGRGMDNVLLETAGNASGRRSRFFGPVSIALGRENDTLQLGVAGQIGNRAVFGDDVTFDGGTGTDTIRRSHAVFANKPGIFRFELINTAIDVTAPTLSATNPSLHATGIALNRKIAATFSEDLNPATVNAATFTLKGPGTTPVLGTVAYVGRTATFTPATDLAANTQYTGTITTGVKDLAGNALASTRTWTFTTGAIADTTAPTVTSTDPASTATGVALNKVTVATFSEAMDPSTLTSTTFTLKGPGTTPVLGTVTYVGTTATFSPTSDLAASTLYTARISTGAQDLAGNALASNRTWTFTTGTTPDTTAPTVAVTNPLNNATNVVINKTIATTFSEAMDPTSITSATFTLKGPGTTSVTGTVSYDAVNKIASFTPTADLAASTLFTARISGGVNGVTDLAGNPLANDLVWTFTTGTQVAQAPINLGAANGFAIIARAATSGSGNTINGDVGLNPAASSFQGIPPSEVNGDIHVGDQAVIDAQDDLSAAYLDAVGRSTSSVSLAGNIGGQTITPGLYTNATSVLIQGSGPNNNVTLDAQGDPNAIFIFKMGSTLTVGAGAHVILAGGANANNIYWQVGTSATLNTNTIFYGNILAATTITVNNGTAIVGRILAGSSNPSGAVTISASTITVP